MAYLTCPWCLTPQMIADEAYEYRCFTCFAEIRFSTCPECKLVQTVNKGWRAYECSKCRAQVELPLQWRFADSSKAMWVRGTGKPWPPL